MRYLTALTATIILHAAAIAVDKKPEEKVPPGPKVGQLIGSWRLTHFDNDPADVMRQTMVFAEEGKVSTTFARSDHRMVTRQGTYWLEGNELHLSYEEGNGYRANKVFVHIKELTPDRLMVAARPSEGGTRLLFKRVAVEERGKK